MLFDLEFNSCPPSNFFLVRMGKRVGGMIHLVLELHSRDLMVDGKRTVGFDTKGTTQNLEIYIIGK